MLHCNCCFHKSLCCSSHFKHVLLMHFLIVCCQSATGQRSCAGSEGQITCRPPWRQGFSIQTLQENPRQCPIGQHGAIRPHSAHGAHVCSTAFQITLRRTATWCWVLIPQSPPLPPPPRPAQRPAHTSWWLFAI
jgi:hypothetical protein